MNNLNQKIPAISRLFNLYALLILFVFASCHTEKKSKSEKDQKTNNLTPDHIIQKAIEYSGKNKFNDHKIVFDFRDKTYVSENRCGHFKMTRIDSSKNIKDVLFENQLKRKVKGASVQLADTLAAKIKSSINSVHYFVQLPYRLKDQAVKAKKLKDDTIGNKIYYQLQVQFKEAGGGEDYQDIYRYWFDQKDFSLDYLAYQFHTNSGGMRFRAKREEKKLNAVIFQDYDNFKPVSKNLSLKELSTAYQNNKLEKVSEINTIPIAVKPSDKNCN